MRNHPGKGERGVIYIYTLQTLQTGLFTVIKEEFNRFQHGVKLCFFVFFVVILLKISFQIFHCVPFSVVCDYYYTERSFKFKLKIFCCFNLSF